MAISSHQGVWSSTDIDVLRKGESTGKNVALLATFKTPIQPDTGNFVHTNLRKNNRQPYAISELAGHQTRAESWGTGRAVARIPRIQDEPYGTWRKAASFKSNYNSPMHKMLNRDLRKILKSPEIKKARRAPRRVLKKNPLKKLRIVLKLNPYAKTMCRNTILYQAKNHKLWVDKTAAAPEAISDEKGVPCKKPVVEKKRKKAVSITKQKKSLAAKEAATTRKPAAEKKLTEKKSTTEEKKPVA
uniref:Large ribosomal subunit protein uL4 C-terminal domain-containing protein n=1 Tax=Rousettus aegyptiacus TaxID=9407 RepID=A0A7J8JG94_ROUAE|nr:hypothetical protein HJG63_010226 [Rousettus aegyptiacus]